MSVDSGLTSDSCTMMQDSALPSWWLSNDILLATSPAVPGAMNDVNLTVRKGASGCAWPVETSFINVDLYVCVPTGSPFVLNGGQVKKIQDAGPNGPDILVALSDLPSAGSAFTQTVKWNIPPITASSHPAEIAGHKCLLARAYSDIAHPAVGLLPNDVVPDDQHYAQHNICIQTCSSPCGQDVMTEAPENDERDREVTFMVTADVRPSQELLKNILPILKQEKGFRRVVARAPGKGFALQMRDFPDAKMTDNTRPGCFSIIQGLFKPSKSGGYQPNFEAQIRIKRGQVSTYQFLTDLDGSEPGDAHIFHLVHKEQNQVLSGLTIVMLKV